MSTLIKDLIEIPEQVSKSDLVLKLTDGLAAADATVRQYVLTEQLRDAFKKALSLVSSAIAANTSRAAYLHGSFGSGKSHFMAILDLLLSNHTALSSKPELQSLIETQKGWLQAQKFLLVPYHMVGATSLAEAILGHYVEHVHKLHPDKPTPPVYRSAALFDNAKQMCQDVGEAKFFERLNQSASKGSSEGWGLMSTGWDATRFAKAIQSPPTSPLHLELVSALVETWFTSFKVSKDNLVSLDEGLSIISAHAQSLGYTGLVLFLDELVLWLLSHSADAHFVQTQGEELVKLVEAQNANRAIPVISFIARQRDLSKVLGAHVAASQQANFEEVLNHHSGRFEVIKLEDTNLPVIIRERLLKPKDDHAKEQIKDAFNKTSQNLKHLRDILKTQEGSNEDFLAVYPFSPALIQALVAISGALQRERTALKALLHLLVEQRNALELGSLVPVGDLWDVVAEADAAISTTLGNTLETAKKLYRTELRPMLLDQAGLPKNWNGEQQLVIPNFQALIAKFRTNDRFLKTILLASLVPDVEAFKDINATRLLALNHGTIKTAIPGQEAALLLRTLREWAAQSGKIRLGSDSSNPTVSVVLADVDVDGILHQVAHEDTLANRQRLVQEILFKELDIDLGTDMFQCKKILWGGHQREVEILYTNVRLAQDSSFRPTKDGWKLIIDYPFDEQGYGISDDRSKVQEISLRLRQKQESFDTLVWLPDFFTDSEQQSLGKLVRMEYLLKGGSDDRLKQYTENLSPADRSQAKILLEAQQSTLREQLKLTLIRVYGIGAQSLEAGQTAHAADHFLTLRANLQLRVPAASNLKDSLLDLLEQCWKSQWPANPGFIRELKERDLIEVLESVSEALSKNDRRLVINDTNRRKLLLEVAQPLKLGDMHEQAFVASKFWSETFDRLKAGKGVDTLRVSQLQEWIDEPNPWGISNTAKNLIILCYANQTSRVFYRLNEQISISRPNDLARDFELKEQPLPSEQEWQLCQKRGSEWFGLNQLQHLNAQSLSIWCTQLKAKSSQFLQGASQLESALRNALQQCNVPTTDNSRLDQAHQAKKLLDLINRKTKSIDLAQAMADFTMPNFPANELGKTMESAAEVAERLSEIKWVELSKLCSRPDQIGQESISLRAKLAASLSATVLSSDLETVCYNAISTINDLLSRVLDQQPPAPTPVPNPPPAPNQTRKKIPLQNNSVANVVSQLEEFVQQNPGKRIAIDIYLEDQNG